MLRQRPAHSLTEYVHFMRQSFDEYNETCEMIDGSAAIQPHYLRLLMLRGISSTCHFGQAKQCVINAFDTNYLLSSDGVMAIILHLAHNMETELQCTDLPTFVVTAPPISAFMAADRGSHGGRGHPGRGGQVGRGLPNKCNTCGSLDQILSSCIAYDAALLNWTLAKRKMIVHTYAPPATVPQPTLPSRVTSLTTILVPMHRRTWPHLRGAPMFMMTQR
jgi:hypothetical protein